MTVERVVVLGASPKPERYSNKALKMLVDYGHDPVPVAPVHTEIEGRPVVSHLELVEGSVDTVTLYVGTARQGSLAESLVKLKPRRVIFNPGTENPSIYHELKAAGIEPLEACTLVLLSTGQF